eukprot:664749_1
MGNSQPKKQGKDPKINKLIDFMYGLVDDAVVTDEEWEELEEYKKNYNIDNDTYIKALKKMGYTIKDVIEMRTKERCVHKIEVQTIDSYSTVYVDNSTVSTTAIYVVTEKKSKDNKSSKAPTNKTKIKLRADGSMGRFITKQKVEINVISKMKKEGHCFMVQREGFITKPNQETRF